MTQRTSINRCKHLVWLILATAVIFLLLSTLPTLAAPGDLDPTFGSGGKVTHDFGSGFDGGQSIITTPDNKILVAGFAAYGYDFALIRYESDGSLDPSFGSGGIVRTDFGGDDFGYAMVLQTDGKILVTGLADNGSNDDFALARYESDGNLDTTFGIGGKVPTDFNNDDDKGVSIALQDDGKILVAGTTDIGSNTNFALARYESDGSLDTSFGTSGKVMTDFGNSSNYGYSVIVQPDDKILVGGVTGGGVAEDFALARFDSNGAFDPTFGSSGKVITDFTGRADHGYALVFRPGDKILLIGYSSGGSSGGGYNFAIRWQNSCCRTN